MGGRNQGGAQQENAGGQNGEQGQGESFDAMLTRMLGDHQAAIAQLLEGHKADVAQLIENAVAEAVKTLRADLQGHTNGFLKGIGDALEAHGERLAAAPEVAAPLADHVERGPLPSEVCAMLPKGAPDVLDYHEYADRWVVVTVDGKKHTVKK